jgi:hypothetical protein
MKSKQFTLWFVGLFLLVVVVLSLVFTRFSFFGFEEGAKSALWSVIILLFLLLGIIVISLYINYVRRKLGN